MNKRNWTPTQIKDTLRTTGKPYTNRSNPINPGNPRSRFTHPKTGQSLIRDDITGDIIELGEKGFSY
jgi:hypothetical protein